MTARVGSIEVLFRANYGALETGAGRAAGSVERNAGRMDKAVKRTDRNVLGLRRTMNTIHGREFRVLVQSVLRAKAGVERLRSSLLATTALFGGLGAAFSLKGIQEYSDTYKEVGNRLRIVKSEAQNLADVQDKVFDIAQRSRSQYKATGVLFARLAASARKLNISQRDTLRVTETIQKAFLVGGSTNVESAQSAIQLSQGIASDRLQGDELRSVLENPALGQLLADKISDGDLGALRQLAKEGKLTAREVIGAFKSASEEIDRLFAATEQTVGQAFVKIDNALLKYIGRSDAVSQATGSTVLLLNSMAENFDSVADSIVILAGAMGVLLGARALGGITARVAATTAAFKLNRAEMLRTATAAKALAASNLVSAETKLVETVYRSNAVIKEKRSSLKQVERAQKASAAATAQYQAAARASTVATAQYSSTLKALTVSSTLAAGGMNVLRGAMAFVGGPIGVAFIALSAAMFVVGQNSADAAERADRYAKAIKDAGEDSDGAAKSIRQVAAELSNVSKAATEADRILGLKQAREDLTHFQKELSGFRIVAGVFREAGVNTDFFQKSVKDLTDQFIEGNLTLSEFIARSDELAKMSDGTAKIAREMQVVARRVEAARGAVDGLTSAMDGLSDAVDGVDSSKIAELYDPLRKIDSYLSSQREFNREISKEINIQQLTGQAYKIARKEQDLLTKAKKAGLDLTGTERRDIRSQAQEIVRLEKIRSDASRKSTRSRKTEAERVAERFEKRLDRLQYKAQSIDFSQIDRETINIARSVGIADAEIRQFISATEGEGKPPARLAAIKEVLQQISQLEFNKKLEGLREGKVLVFLSDLDRKTVEAARSFGVAEEAVKNFISAAANGELKNIPPQISQIRSELEDLARSERIATFADGLGDAVAQFANSATSDIKNVDDAISDLIGNVKDLIFQLLVAEPLKNAVSGSLGSLFAGGGGFSTAASLASAGIGGLFHTGGKVGTDRPKSSMVLSGAQIAKAPRFHDGLGSKEFAAVLEQGERVLTAEQDNRMIGTLSGLTSAIQSGTGDGGTVKIVPSEYFDAIVDARSAKQASVAINKTVPGMVGGIDRERKRRGAG